MLSGIPLPNAPAGSVQEGMKNANALTAQNLGNQISQVKARYAPLTTQAEAASKLAYANLMGPQFMAKLFGNTDVLANIPESQKGQILQTLLNAGGGRGTGNSMMNLSGGMDQFIQQRPNPIAYIANRISELFNNGQSNQQQSQQQQTGNQNPAQQFMNSNPQIANAMRDQFQRTGEAQYTIPTSQQGSPQTFAENVGTYEGTKQEGREAGKIRAQDIKELNDLVFNAETKQETLNDINNMISSPEIREIRQIPLAGRHEMGWYAKFGTPAQQQLIGRLESQMGNVVKDSARDFQGQFRTGEQKLLSGMKPNPGDTIDAMIGKAESLSVMNEMLLQRSRLTSQLMQKYHMSKGQALENADKQINGKQIRESVHNKLNPRPTDADIRHMSEKYGISESEVNKRLKAKGII